MAVERIEELLNPQAVEAFKELVKVLTEAVQKEDDLLKKSAQLSEQLQGGSVKNYNKTLQELNTTSEKITQTDSQRLNIERELKAQSDKAIQVLKTETEEQKKLQQAIEKYTVDTEELAFSYTRLSQKVESYNAKIKSAKQEQKDLGKELRNGIITQSEYDSKVEQLVATMAEAKLNVEKYKLELAKNQQAIKANIKEEIASTGSLEQKSVQLGKLRSLWGALTESEREQAKQDGVTLQAIQRLDEELKAEEGQLGLNQRRVGEYEIAGNALGGSQVSLRSQIRTIREELAQQMMVFEQSGALIQKQKMLTDQLATSKGKESQEYREAKAELDRLTQSQTTAQQAMQKLQEEGGKLQDIYGDASGRVKALSSDFANTDAAVQGVGLLVDGYTVFQSALVAMGIESEDLMNIFSKLMILQQGMNSVSQITKALQSESILRTKLEVLWLKLKAASTKQNAVETVKDTVAMGVDTAAKGAETAATITATGANVGLSAAIKSVGVAIKSVPVIGWILAAVAALGTLTVLLYRHLSAEKELTSEQKKQEAFTKSMLSIEVETAKNTAETVTKLNAYLSVLKQVKEGSNTWKSAVKQISELTGIDYNTLVKHPKKIDEITEAWRVMYMKRSKWEASINTISQKNADAMSAKMTLSNLHLIDTSSEEFEAELAKLGKKTTDFAITLDGTEYDIEKWAKKVKKSGSKYTDIWGAMLDIWVGDTQEANDKIMNAIDFSGITFENNNKDGGDKEQSTADKEKALQEKRIEYITNANQKIEELDDKTNEEIYNSKKAEIEKEYQLTILKFSDSEDVKKKALELRNAQLTKLEIDNNTALNDKLTSLRKELYSTLDELETMRANSKLSDDELTNALVDIEKRKNDRILADNEASFEKEAKLLDVNSAEYLALRKKWDAANELQAQKSENNIENIKKTGFEKQLERVKNSIAQVPAFASDQVTEAEYNVKVTGSAVEELEKIKNNYKDLGYTEQQYQDMSVAAQQAATDAKMALIQAEKAVRQELAMTIVGGLVDIGTALAESVEDEKKRVKIQQSLALVQVLLQQGIAIANAIAAASSGGDPYTLAIRIAAAVIAVTTSIISATNAIKEANNITSYAEGTGAGGHKGGLALMGEGKAKKGSGYEPELVEIGNKKMIVTSPVIADLPAGAIVTPFYKLQNEDRALSLEETNSLLNNIYNKKQASVEVNVGRGIEYIVRRGLDKTKILNSRFKLN